MSPSPPMINVPFGYAWTEAEEGENASSQPPSGPPLLDNAESSILRNFFDDPNNVDPQFLALGQNLQDPSNGLPDFAAFNWEPQANIPAPDIKPQPFNAASLNQPSHTFNAFTAQPTPKDEDLFAANILQTGLTQPVNGHGGQMGQQSFIQPLPQKTPTSMPPPASTFAGGQMVYPSNTFQTQNGQFARPANAAPAGTVGLSGPQRPLEPLNFGSDAGFRNHYAGSASFEAPDRELKSLITEHFQQYGTTPQPLGKHAAPTSTSGDTTPQTPATKGKKRESEFAIEDEGSSEDEDASRPTKRRRNKVKEEDKAEDDEDDEEEEEEGQSSRKSKKQSKKAPGSPGKRRKSSPSASKVVRENLSEAQKRSNHIQSEQKRRNLIKQGFEDLTRMVPELRPGGLSKSNMLVEAAKFIREIRDNNEKLKQRMDTLNPG